MTISHDIFYSFWVAVAKIKLGKTVKISIFTKSTLARNEKVMCNVFAPIILVFFNCHKILYPFETKRVGLVAIDRAWNDRTRVQTLCGFETLRCWPIIVGAASYGCGKLLSRILKLRYELQSQDNTLPYRTVVYQWSFSSFLCCRNFTNNIFLYLYRSLIRMLITFTLITFPIVSIVQTAMAFLHSARFCFSFFSSAFWI